MIAATFEPRLAGLPDPVLRAEVIVVVCGLATILTGLGWMFVLGGLALTLNVPLAGLSVQQFGQSSALAPAMCCVALAVLLYALDRRLRHWAVIPSLLAVAFVQQF